MLEELNQMSRIAELEADNRRLRRLLDQRDAPGELRHRLRSTVAMLRTIIRRTAESKRDFESYVDHLEDRLDALMRAHSAADDRGSVSLYHLLADELLQYGVSESERATLSGPQVELQPRAGQVLAMAIHELTVNAVEHGSLDDGTGRVEIAWDVHHEEGQPWLTFSWKERGGTAKPDRTHEGFGTEVLTRLLGYELRAHTHLAFEEGALHYMIRFPLPEQIGRVVQH